MISGIWPMSGSIRSAYGETWQSRLASESFLKLFERSSTVITLSAHPLQWGFAHKFELSNIPRPSKAGWLRHQIMFPLLKLAQTGRLVTSTEKGALRGFFITTPTSRSNDMERSVTPP